MIILDDANLTDVEAEAERHLRQHQVQGSVDVIDAELIQRLTPVDQAEHQSYELQHVINQPRSNCGGQSMPQKDSSCNVGPSAIPRSSQQILRTE